MMNCSGLQEMSDFATENKEDIESLSRKTYLLHFSLFTSHFSPSLLPRIESGSLTCYAKKSFWLTAVFILTIIILQSGCQTSDGSWERVQAAGVLRVGLDPTYPPFEVADANGVYGLDVDLAQASPKIWA